MTERKKGIAYGWVIVIANMFMQAVVFGVASNIHPQFTAYVVEGEGFTLAQFSLMFTIGTIVSAFASPFIGKTYGKIPLKIIFSAGTIVSMGGIILLSTADSYGMFYLGYSLGQVGISAVTGLGAPILINSWFGESLRGRALGLTFAGGSIGNVILQSVVVRILSNPEQGYKFAYLWFGVFALLFGLIITLLFIRMPRDSSEVLGASDTPGEKKEIELWGYRIKDVTRLNYFWLFCTGFIFVGFYIAGLAMQYATYLNYLEITPVTIGAVGSTFALSSLIGNVAGGTLFDKLGIFKSMAIAFVCVALAAICLIFTPELTPLAFAFAVLKGLSVYSYMSSPSILTGRLFGNKEFASILAIINIFFAIGVSAGSPLFGILADSLGWRTSWLVVLGFIIAAYFCILAAIKGIEHINKEKFGKVS